MTESSFSLLAGRASKDEASRSNFTSLLAPTPAKKVFLTAHKANFYSEAAVNQACQDRQGGKHRFLVALPFGYGFDSRFFVHGIRIVDGVANEAIAGSGIALRRLDMPQLPFAAATVPPISGSYRRLTEHPRVFTTAAEIMDLIPRINRPGSYSARRYGQLASQIASDLAGRRDWDATYSGCYIGPYLYAFSYESQDGHDAETHAAMKLDANTFAPAGGAVVASRLALYAALAKAGAVAPQGAPTPDQAAALGKRILLAWADHGFPRDAQGHFRPLLSALSCDKDGKNELYSGGGVALQLGRGVFYSVHAQDLLQSMGGLNGSEKARLDAMHQNLFDLILEAVNQSLARCWDRRSAPFAFRGTPQLARSRRPPRRRRHRARSRSTRFCSASGRTDHDSRGKPAYLGGGGGWMRVRRCSVGPECHVALTRGAHGGHIDGIRFEGDQFHIWGWACQVGNKASIELVWI
jgi:hypothetical protein